MGAPQKLGSMAQILGFPDVGSEVAAKRGTLLGVKPLAGCI